MIRLMNLTPETAYEAFAGVARKYVRLQNAYKPYTAGHHYIGRYGNYQRSEFIEINIRWK